jgi:hypothetical protein
MGELYRARFDHQATREGLAAADSQRLRIVANGKVVAAMAGGQVICFG